jgi:hypothetical protein
MRKISAISRLFGEEKWSAAVKVPECVEISVYQGDLARK